MLAAEPAGFWMPSRPAILVLLGRRSWILTRPPERLAAAAGHRYWLGQIEDFTTEERFDLVLMLNLIEHVRRPDRVLARARELLSEGGVLVVKTPNFDALDARIFRHRSWGGYHTPRHFVLFTRASFQRLAQAQGLEVVSFAYTQGAPFWSVSVLNEMRRLGWIRCSREHPTTIPSAQSAAASRLRGIRLRSAAIRADVADALCAEARRTVRRTGTPASLASNAERQSDGGSPRRI